MAPFYYLLILMITASQVSARKYRLPSTCSLNSVAVSLDIGEEAFSNNTSYEYDGLSIISLQVTESVSTLQFHASYEYISISLILLNNVQYDTWEIDNATDIVTLTLDSELVTGKNYSLLISYTAKLSTNDTFGFYKTSYTNSDGSESYFLGTRFEPTYARRVFPCFDEPGYKSPVGLTVRYPSNRSSLSNTEVSSSSTSSSLTTATFSSTSNTSSYLVSWALSDFNSTEVTLSDGSTKCRLWSRNASASSREWALNVTSRLVDSLNTLTGINISKISSKIDLLAVPDFSEDAAQSWGLITLRESDLLWDSEESSISSKQQVAKSLGFVLAGAWFGSSVTAKWWNDLYLSEGFAAYYQSLALNEAEPDFEIPKQYVTKNLHRVLESDSLSKTESVQSNAKTTAQIKRKFGTISSDKGGCLFRMAESFLGNDSFRSGVKNYLTSYQNKTAESTQLWDALNSTANFTLSSLPADVDTIMETWTTQEGYPVIHVSLKDDTVTFRQERFLQSGSDCLAKWYVPISYVTSDDNGTDFESTYPRLWLTPDKPTVSISYNASSTKWLLVNNKQTGYYRVNYDSNLRNRLSTALDKSNFSNITEVNRAQICDDTFNLAKAKRLSYSKALDNLQFLQDDESYYSWESAFRGFDYIIKRVGQYSSLGSSIGNHVLKLSKKVRRSAPLATLNTSNTVYTQKQNLVNKWACKLGDSDAVKYVREQFEEYKSTSVRPNKDLRNLVYSYGLRYSTSASNDWNFLWKAYKESGLASERSTIVEALGYTTNNDILNEYLQKTIRSDSNLRAEDRAAAFSSVYKGNSEGVDVALDFLTQNHKAIIEKYNGKKNVGKAIQNLADHFSREDQLTKLNTFITENDFGEEIRAYTNDAIEAAQVNLQWTKQHQNELSSYYRIQESCRASSVVSGSSASTCSCNCGRQ